MEQALLFQMLMVWKIPNSGIKSTFSNETILYIKHLPLHQYQVSAIAPVFALPGNFRQQSKDLRTRLPIFLQLQLLFVILLLETKRYMLVLPFSLLSVRSRNIIWVLCYMFLDHVSSNSFVQPEPFCSMIIPGLKLSYRTL